MDVIGIDPAPGKGVTLFDGADGSKSIRETHAYLARLAVKEDVLICWDAPLTGPSRRALAGDGILHKSDFTQRRIESFFSRGETGFRTPKGISVSGYSSCPHWTLSRSLLGLPRVGPWDRELADLPFRLVHGTERRPEEGRWIIEVHPGVAAWLWCLNRPPGTSWKYKKDAAVLQAMWEGVVSQTGEIFADEVPPQNDDEFDARIAYALGVLWLENAGQVELLGNLDDGTFLLPNVPGLPEAFSEFTE